MSEPYDPLKAAHARIVELEELLRVERDRSTSYRTGGHRLAELPAACACTHPAGWHDEEGHCWSRYPKDVHRSPAYRRRCPCRQLDQATR